MAKSLRSKRKRKMRRERREKFKPRETKRLLETLGVNEAEKGEDMAIVLEEKDSQDGKQNQENEHVEDEPTQNTNDIEMDQEKTQQNSKTSNKKVDRKQLLKRLGKKRHFKKVNKKIKW